MPIYEYRCTSCGRLTEVFHGFDEQHTGVCPTCGDALTRHFSASNILFKGSGFYVNDSRPSEKSGDAPVAADAPSPAAPPPAAGPAPASTPAPAPPTEGA